MSVWRELRRIKQLPADAPDHLRVAHRAANKHVQHDGDEHASVAWDDYCRAQGGAQCSRKAAIKLATRPADKPGQYGDLGQPRLVGVNTAVAIQANPIASDEGKQFPRILTVESERKAWTVAPARLRRYECSGLGAAPAKPAQPWTRVHNCTVLDAANLSLVGAYSQTSTPPSGLASRNYVMERVHLLFCSTRTR